MNHFEPATNLQKPHQTELPATLPKREVATMGVVGAGRHFVRSHLQHLSEDQGCRIAGVFDTNPGLGDQLSQLTGTPVLQSASEAELLAGPCTAVFISTPDHLHADSLMAAVRAGKHVFVEKPLAVTSAQLETVVDALKLAEAKGLIVSTCHPRRCDPPFVWLKEMMPSLIERFGAPIEFTFDFSYHKPSDWKLSRGLLIDHANHEIDLVHYFFGHSPASCTKLYDTPKGYHVAGMREDGMAFSFRGTRHLESHVFNEWVGVRFERGRIEVCATNGSASIRHDETGETQSFPCPSTDYSVRFGEVTRNFLRAIEGSEKPYVTHDDLRVNTEFAVKLSEGAVWQSTPNEEARRRDIFN